MNKNEIEKNIQINTNLVRPRHLHRLHVPREKREEMKSKLHFEYGIPAIRIAEMIKVDRNTINKDLKVLYDKAIRHHNSDMTFDEVIEKQLLRLETQPDRLGLYLCDIKNINSKVTIERLIADIDFKVIWVIERINQNIVQHYDAVIEYVNK